jgi:hypothetical protein
VQGVAYEMTKVGNGFCNPWKEIYICPGLAWAVGTRKVLLRLQQHKTFGYNSPTSEQLTSHNINQKQNIISTSQDKTIL